MTQLASIIGRAKEQVELNEVLDCEGFASFEDFISSVSHAVIEALDWIRNNHKYADINTPSAIGSHIKTLEDIGYTSLSEVNVYLPPYCKTDMLSYADALHKQIKMIADIHTRVYEPVREFLEHAVGLEDYHNKPFSDRRFKALDVEKLRKEFNKVNADIDRDDEEELNMVSEAVMFKNAFRNINQVKQAEEKFLAIGKLISTVNLDYLKKEEARILEQLALLMDQIAEGKKDDFSKAAKKQIAKLLTDIAIETEYFSVLLFTANVSIESWNKTVEKLKKL